MIRLSLHKPFQILILLAACGLAAPAIAQDALGNGRGLERNSSRYPQTQQPRGGRDFAAEVRFRNAIVTGNAPNGLSFRGNSGYSDANDFRGKLGSDDLYSYRRDSYVSGLSGQGIRGTDALQYQFALTTGSSAPSGLAGSLDISRSGARSTGQQNALARDRVAEDRDRSGNGSWLRSPSAFEADRSLQPTSLGSRRTSEGLQETITASSLLGVRSRISDTPVRPRNTKPNKDGTTPAGSPDDKPAGRPSDAPSSVDGWASQRLPSQLLPRHQQPTDAASPDADKSKPQPFSAYDSVFTRFDEWERKTSPVSETTPGQLTRVENRLLGLRRHLLGEQANAAPLPTPVTNPRAPAPAPQPEQLDSETVRMIREASGKASGYAVAAKEGDSVRDFYSRDLLVAQKLLAEGRYFDAEDRFSRALISRQGDPTALAGRLHAQLGSGMYLSASVNLRQLLFTVPEFAGVKFVPAMLPSKERLDQIVARLRGRLSGTGDQDPVAQSIADRDVGIVIAYIGFQTGDSALLNEGLATADKPETPGERADPISARLHAYLRAVWLGEMPASKALPPDPTAPPTPDAVPIPAK